MKPKYYPHGSFMEATLCKRPLFSWRSISSAWELLNEGMLWRIRSGETVNIWGDKWMPAPTTFTIQSPKRSFSEHAKVAELIDPDTKGWDVLVINIIFGQKKPRLSFGFCWANTDKKMFWFGDPQQVNSL